MLDTGKGYSPFCFFVLGILIACVGSIAGLFWGVRQKKKMDSSSQQILLPARDTLNMNRGHYLVVYERRRLSHTRVPDTASDLKRLQLTLRPKNQKGSTVTISTPSWRMRDRNALGELVEKAGFEFEIDSPGDYVVEADHMGGPEEPLTLSFHHEYMSSRVRLVVGSVVITLFTGVSSLLALRAAWTASRLRKRGQEKTR